MRNAFALAFLALAACHSAPCEQAWIDLFDGRALGAFVATEFGGEGAVELRDGCIQIDMGSPLSGITWTGAPPRGSYELEVVAARRLGTDFFCGLTFPVGADHLTLVLGGWGGTVCGLSSLDGKDAAHNATRTLHRFEPGRDYTVRVRVDANAVSATIDGVPLCSTDLAGHALSLRPEVLLSRPLGLANFATATSVRTVRWRPLPTR